MPRANQLEVDRACVLMIDLQEKLLPLIADRQRVLKACRKLLDGVRIFELPVVATEQYPHGLGPTDETLRPGLEATRATVVEKPTFSGWAHPAARDAQPPLRVHGRTDGQYSSLSAPSNAASAAALSTTRRIGSHRVMQNHAQ